MNLYFESPAFSSDTFIPKPYTCLGKNISPPLFWFDSGNNTHTYVILLTNEEASPGKGDHWIIYNISPFVKHLRPGTHVPIGAAFGKNSWGEASYKGPCPSTGTNEYLFRLYALDTLLTFTHTPSKEDILKAMSGHIIATSEFTGLVKAQPRQHER